MKCAVHAEVDATGYCRSGGKATCEIAREACARCGTVRHTPRDLSLNSSEEP
jgi:hypothetical protein